MELSDRIKAFERLGTQLKGLSPSDREVLAMGAKSENAWFTDESVRQAVSGIAFMLEPTALKQWLGSYAIVNSQPKKVGVAMAGNIPLVGFHDLLCIVLSGHIAVVKLSSQDQYLMRQIIQWLYEIDPKLRERIKIEERLNHVDAIIATGSDNTARYFEYYFRNIPRIIRKNRSSCAVIMGEESPEEISKLGIDIFSYFGLGCRNVSKIYLPEGYEINNLMEPIESFQSIIHHNKYVNNYDYRKSIFLVNRQPHYDNGFLLLIENSSVVSPISVVHFEYYATLQDLDEKIAAQKEKIQCVVSAQGWYKGSVPFGKAQLPDPWDYADQVDTMQFLLSI